MIKECEKPIKKSYLMTESEMREEVRRLLWEMGVSKLLNEYAGANDTARDITIKISNRIGELRPLKKEDDFFIEGPDGGDIIIKIIPDDEFIDAYGDVEGNYNPMSRRLCMRMNRINADDWLSYVYNTLMHEFTHTLQFKTTQQLNKYRYDNRKEGEELSQEIGYIFNAYEIGARIGSADFFFRSFIESCGLKPEELRMIPYEKIIKTFKNSLMLNEMREAISRVERMEINQENSQIFADIASRLSQSTKAKGANLYKKYTNENENNLQYILKLRILVLDNMKKLYNDYVDRLQKLWEYLITDYNGKDFKSYYIR